MESGLRQKQRLATLRDLHAVALDLALTEGPAAATVDVIAERAGVSRRTFFNYYATKEDAILGIVAPTVPQADLDAFFDDTGHDELAAAVDLFLATVRTSRAAVRSKAQVKRVVTAHPELRVRVRHHWAASQELLVNALSEHFHAVDGVDAADKAQVLAMLAASVVRFAYIRDAAGSVVPAPAVVDDAIGVFRSTMKDLA